MEAFIEAAKRGDFEVCYQALASPLRERYTPSRLAQDFTAVKGTAEDKLERAKAALAHEPRMESGRAEFAISDRKAVKLVYEPDGWKVSALE